MSETLSYRVGRLMSGGFHAILDKAEDLAPEVALNEHIREIERAIDEVRDRLGKVLAQKHLATKKLMEENARYDALADNIQTALSLGRDDLAEVGVGEQMDIEARLPVIENTIADCALQEKELEGFIVALGAKRREMQNALDNFRTVKANNRSTEVGIGTSRLEDIAGRAAKSGNAFDRVMHRQTGLNLGGHDTKKLADLEELENLSRTHRIAERLASLKVKQGK